MKSIVRNIIIFLLMTATLVTMASCVIAGPGGSSTTGLIVSDSEFGSDPDSGPALVDGYSSSDAATSGQIAVPAATESETVPAITSEEPQTTSASSVMPLPEEPTISETLCFEYNGLKVVAKKLTSDSIFGRGVKIYIENGTSTDLSVGVRQLIVNDCMVSSLFYSTVAAGKKANDTLYISDSDLTDAGIEDLCQIEAYFYVYDPNTYHTVYESECVTIKTSVYEKMSSVRVAANGETMYDKDGIKIVGKYVRDSLLGKSFVLYLENQSGKDVTISCDDMSVNGYMVTPFFSETVFNGKYTISDITVSDSDLEKNEISKIEEFELKFRIYDPQTYKDISTTDALNFKVK